MSETFIRLIHFNTSKIQDLPSLRTGQKSTLQIYCFDVILMFANYAHGTLLHD